MKYKMLFKVRSCSTRIEKMEALVTYIVIIA